MWQTITINYKKMKVIEIDMDNLDKLPEILKDILDKIKMSESKASADWKNYETACEEPKIPAPKFKIWAEVVFDYDNKNITPVYIKIWSVTYSDKTKKWIYNFNWKTALEEEDLRYATLPEVIQYFRP